MKTLTEEQTKALFLSLLVESLEDALSINILSEEDETKLLEKINEVNKGRTELEVFSQILDTITLLLSELGIREQAKGDSLQ